MRSRYTAYCKNLVCYVVDSTHPDNPMAIGTAAPEGAPSRNASTLEEDVRATCEKINWEKLKILSTEDGPGPDEAFVTFQAFFKVRGQKGSRPQGWHTQSFTERSRFLREDGRWLYVDGDQEWKE